MNFIIPKNYKFKAKLLGFIDYQTATLNGIWAGILYGIVNLIFSSLQLKIYFFIGLFLPVLLFSVIGIHNENIVSVVIYLFQFYKSQKIYLYKKKT